MGFFARLWRVIKGLLFVGLEKVEDPEIILTEAQNEMKRELDRAKENAVQAIQQRNILRGMLQEQQNRAATLESQARLALKQGQDDLARQILVEKGSIDDAIASLTEQLQRADQVAENVKRQVAQFETQVRQKAAEKLALVAGWKQAQIQERLNRALNDINVDKFATTFDRASERVREMQAKAEARSELGEGSLDGRIADLQVGQVNMRAEEDLQRLKAEMGLATEQPQQQQTIRNIEV